MQYSPRPRPTEADELKAELVRNAAFVAYEGKKAKALSQWVAAGPERRVIYVFDTDVIVAHCAPWASGPADDQFLGRGYGQVLPLKPLHSLPVNGRQEAVATERRRAEAVCWLLTNKALERAFGQRMPILQAKPHFEETLRVFEAVKAHASRDFDVSRKSPDERRDNVISQMLRFVSSAVVSDAWQLDGNPGKFLSAVLNRMQTRDLQQASRSVREWDGFLGIIRKSAGIFELSEFSIGPGQFEEWEKVRAGVRSGMQDTSYDRTALHEVFARLIAPEHYQLRRERLHVDVETFTILAEANRELELLGNDRLKVVLITGDRKAVLSLASSRAMLPDYLGRTVSDFAFDHVHHLWSFVDGLVADTAPQAEPVRSELFSGLLAFEGDEADSHDSRLVSYAIRAEPELAKRIHLHDIGQAYSRWDDYTEGAANLHRHFLVDPVKLSKISEILVRKFKLRGQGLNTSMLMAMVKETMARARDRTNVEFSEIGANSILEAHRHGVRNPPDLMFDSLKRTDRIFKDLALPHRVFIDARDFALHFEQIAEDCYQPDPANLADDDYREESYVKYLVLGALFASANRWIVAEQHAESATRIVERSRRLNDPIRTKIGEAGLRGTNISGREAHFLLAISRRIRATDEKGYARAEEALKDAVACLDEDQREGKAINIPAIRFDCEYLALSLARYYHLRQGNSTSSCDAAADEVFRKSRGLIEGLLPLAHAALGDIDQFPASTRATIATNILQVGVIARYRYGANFRGTETSPVGDRELLAAIAILVRDTDLRAGIARLIEPEARPAAPDSAQIICSPLMMLYAVVAGLLLHDADIWRPRDVTDLNLLFDKQSASLTSYDTWRFPMLQSFAQGLVTQP